MVSFKVVVEKIIQRGRNSFGRKGFFRRNVDVRISIKLLQYQAILKFHTARLVGVINHLINISNERLCKVGIGKRVSLKRVNII